MQCDLTGVSQYLQQHLVHVHVFSSRQGNSFWDRIWRSRKPQATVTVLLVSERKRSASFIPIIHLSAKTLGAYQNKHSISPPFDIAPTFLEAEMLQTTHLKALMHRIRHSLHACELTPNLYKMGKLKPEEQQ